MASSVVRVGERTRKVLEDLCARTGRSARAILDEAVECYRRQRFLEEANRAFDALRRDRRAWAAELEERRAWDRASTNRLD
jgi:predicted DNA-binding protein